MSTERGRKPIAPVHPLTTAEMEEIRRLAQAWTVKAQDPLASLTTRRAAAQIARRWRRVLLNNAPCSS